MSAPCFPFPLSYASTRPRAKTIQEGEGVCWDSGIPAENAGGIGAWPSQRVGRFGTRLLVGSALADATRALEHGLQRIHHEADARQVGIDGAAGRDDRIGQRDGAGIPRLAV